MKTILDKRQIAFLNEYRNYPALAERFYLTGGTALAEFYLHHRLSEDIDLFTKDEFDPKEIDVFINHVKDVLKPKELYRQKIYDRYAYNFIFTDDILKIEFVRYEFKNLKNPRNIENILVNDIYDIAVNKFFTLFDRNEIKDFVDLYFLLKKYPFERLMKGVEMKFGFKIDPIMIGGELLKMNKTAPMPKMLIPLTKEELICFFKDQAYLLRKKIFDD